VNQHDRLAAAAEQARRGGPERHRERLAERRAEYEQDVDLLRLASDLVIDAVVPPERLRDELITRLAYSSNRDRHFSDRRHGVPPV
jgi:acetyl-CoA carboxylase carboxyltransferase component